MNEQPVALITGANKGIGFETARQLGRKHYTVLVGARDEARGRTAVDALRDEGTDARFVALDVTLPATVAAAAEHIEVDVGRLDVLVNNAGVLGDRNAPSLCDLDEVQRVYEVNVFGAIRVTRAMLPLLGRARPAARIVMVSSGVGSMTRHTDFDGPLGWLNAIGYASSKAALNMVAVQFAKELRRAGIKVNAADPGYTATDFNNHRGTQPVEIGARSTVYLATLGEDGPTGSFFDKDGRVPW